MDELAQNRTLAGGRPINRGVARRQAFLQAAREVFLEQGYEEASVNEIVRRAGGSLATLYAQFASKEGIFLAVAEEQHERFVRAMTPGRVDHLPLEEGLQAMGEQFVHALLSRESLAFFRIIVGEGRKFPQLLQRYVFSGADKVRGVVANYLASAAPHIADAEMVASYFLELLRARHHYRALADDSYVLTNEDITAHVAGVVRFFLAGATRS
jgi:AcrR family transcriptional regulator